MIDLTPLDVRKKAGDFTKALRGYETQQVESFLELAAERLEELVKENLTLRERVDRLGDQVEVQTGREKAVNDALVTAQQLREDIVSSAERAAEAIRTEARADAERIRAEADDRARGAIVAAEERLSDLKQSTREVTRRRARFLASFRQLLERELDMVEVQEEDTLEEYMVVGLGVEAAPVQTPEDDSVLEADSTPGDDSATGHESAAGADSLDAEQEDAAAWTYDLIEEESDTDESSDSGLDEEDPEESDDER